MMHDDDGNLHVHVHVDLPYDNGSPHSNHLGTDRWAESI